MSKPNCFACKHSGMEPSEPDLICWHPDSGLLGRYVSTGPQPHCGPERTKFEQHPGRNPDGSLKR